MTYFPWLNSLTIIIYIEQTHSKNIHDAHGFHQNISKYFLAELSLICVFDHDKENDVPFQIQKC